MKPRLPRQASVDLSRSVHLQAEYEQAKQEYEDAKAAYEEELKKYEADSKQYETDNAAYQQYLKDKAAYDKAYTDYLDAMEQYKKDKDKYDAYLAAKKEYDDAKAAYDTAHEQWVIESGIYDDVVAYNKGIEDSNKDIETKNNDIAAKNEALKDDILSGTVTDASENDKAITDNVNTAKTVNKSVLEALTEYATIQTEKKALVALKAEIEAYTGKIGDSDYDAYLEKVKQYNAAVDEYNKKITAYNAAVTTYNAAVNDYNANKDTTDSSNIGSETGTADWGNINGYETLSHIDVKYSAASTKTVETVTDEDGNIISTEYTDTVTGDTVTGVYPTSDTTSSKFGVKYFSNGTERIASLSKKNDEFSSNSHSLSFNGNSDTISFYMVVQDSEGKQTGLVVNLDPTSVYPEGTFYRGSNYLNLADYRDSKGNKIPTVTIDGETYYNISGMSIFVVSAMTCDAFGWSKNPWKPSGQAAGRADGLDLVLSLQTLFDIHKAASEKTLAFLSLEGKLKANDTLDDEPTFTQTPPTEVPEPTAPTAPTEVKNPGDAPIKPVFDKTEPTAPTMLAMLENVSALDKLTEYEEVTVEIPDEEEPTEEDPTEEEPVEEEPEEEAEAESEDDALPQTGQDWATVALLALGGMFVTAIGWIRRKLEEHA